MLETPAVISPTMQLRRLIMNPIHRIVYRAAYEPDFNIDSFIKGANQVEFYELGQVSDLFD